jgi:hypothetical protein
MAKIPSPEAAPQPGSLSVGGPAIVRDTSGLARGVAELGQGVSQLGRGLQQRADTLLNQQHVADASLADAEYAKGLMAVKDSLRGNNDYTALKGLADDGSSQAMEAASEKIRDPALRQNWLAKTEANRIGFVDGYGDVAYQLQHDENVANLNTAVDAQQTASTDPSATPEQRQAAFDSGLASLDRAKTSGLLTPGAYVEKRDNFIKAAQQGLSLNIYKTMAIENPAQAIADLNASAEGGAGAVAPQIAAASGGAMQFSPEVAKIVAADLKDNALPSEPDLQAAYLSDPKLNSTYANEAVAIYTRKFNGDTGAAIIALAPGGDETMAKAFVKNHDLSALPKGGREFYTKVTAGVAPPNLSALPVVADPKVNLSTIQKPVLNLFEGVQSTFGKQLLITSGGRDAEHNAEVGGAKGSQHLTGNAIDVDWSKLSPMERIRFIQTASAMGFTGIGAYKDHVHLDLGARRAWGPDQKTIASADPALQQALIAHSSGKIEALPPPNMTVAPAARWLTYDQRLQLSDMARQERDRKAIDLKASVDTVVQSAPASYASTGMWDGPTLRPNDFVEAYGGAEGIDRYRAYSAALDVAKQSFSFKTSTNQEIATAIENARPRSTGPGADVELKRYQTLLEAGQQVMKARADDPAGYAQSAFPAVSKAWNDVSQDPTKLQSAVAVTSLAERQMGIDNPALLPKAMASSIVATYKNTELPQADRVNAVSAAVAAGSNDADREAIWNQLVAEGIPPYLGRAFAAQEDAATDPSRAADARFLFMAASIKPEDIPKNLSATTSQINEAVGNQFMPGSIASVIYNLGPAATADNQAKANSDAVLFNNAVQLHMSEGMGLNQAVQLTTQQMWGKIKVASGNGDGNTAGFKITIPVGENVATYRQGFTKMLPEVGHALMDGWDGVLGQQPISDGSRAVGLSVRDNYVRTVLQTGYFADLGAGQGYVFINPLKGTYVEDHYGRPLIFSEEEIKQAGAASSNVNPALPPGNSNVTAERMRTIYGSNFDRPRNAR